jgi:hypothetical protein
MMIGRGNRYTRRKPAPVQHNTSPHILWPDANPGRRGVKPATNCLNYGTALGYVVRMDEEKDSKDNKFESKPKVGRKRRQQGLKKPVDVENHLRVYKVKLWSRRYIIENEYLLW